MKRTAKYAISRFFSSHQMAALLADPQVNKFEKIFSLGHQMTSEVACTVRGWQGWRGVPVC